MASNYSELNKTYSAGYGQQLHPQPGAKPTTPLKGPYATNYINSLTANKGATSPTKVTTPQTQGGQAPLNPYNPSNGIIIPEQQQQQGAQQQNTPTSPTAPSTSNYDQAYQQYIQSLSPSTDVTNSKKAYNDFVAQRDGTLRTIGDQRIPMRFITGQQASVSDRAAIEGNRLQGDIGIAQEGYSQQQNQSKAQLDYQKSVLDEQNKNYQSEQDRAFKQSEFDYKKQQDTQNFSEDQRQFNVSNALAQQKVTGTGGTGAGGYTAGANPVVDSWAERINNGSAKITDIPASQAGLRNQVSVALTSMGNTADGKPTTTELGKAAMNTAQQLLAKFQSGGGNDAVGLNSLFNRIALPGTAKANFINDFNSLKSQLALEGVKYLKGQGAVSDAERALLAQATSKLSLKQSKAEFQKTLNDIITKLTGGSQQTENTYKGYTLPY